MTSTTDEKDTIHPDQKEFTNCNCDCSDYDPPKDKKEMSLSKTILLALAVAGIALFVSKILFKCNHKSRKR